MGWPHVIYTGPLQMACTTVNYKLHCRSNFRISIFCDDVLCTSHHDHFLYLSRKWCLMEESLLHTNDSLGQWQQNWITACSMCLQYQWFGCFKVSTKRCNVVRETTRPKLFRWSWTFCGTVMPQFSSFVLKNCPLSQKSTFHYFPCYSFRLVPEVKNLPPTLQYSL
jgi:hypothetical protein